MTKYRFRYDARGASLEPTPAQVPAKVRAASTAGDAHAAAEAAPPLWGKAVTVVNELRLWLEEHPDFGLDMTILEEREVLLAPPNWRYVASEALALGSLGDRIGNVPSDMEALMKYADMLASRQPFIDVALQTAALASGASTEATPDQQMRAALRALPKGGVIEDLTFKPLPPLLEDGRGDEWLELLRSVCDPLRRQTAVPNDWAAEERHSWQDWKSRFQKYRRKPRNFPAFMRDVLLRTRGAGPPVLFRDELQRMTLREWSEAYLQSVRRKLPGSSEVPVPEWVRGEIYTVLLERRATTLLIVGATETPLAAHWLPSRENGSFWIDSRNMREFPSAFPEIGNAQIIVAFEVIGDAEVIARAVVTEPPTLNLLRVTFDPRRATYVYIGKERLPANVTPALPYVENPKDVDDAIAKARALFTVRRSPSAK